MSEFAVIASALSDHAARLRGFSDEIDAARGRVIGGASAAASTPAAGAVEHLAGHVHGRLADFAAAADALHVAIAGAGDAYVRADACVQESARWSEVVLPDIPTIETYPVSGDAGAITLQAGGLAGTSRLLAGQGQGVSALSAQLAPSWSGEAANGYQNLSAKIAGAFGAAAREVEAAAALMSRYAVELERLQREASTAAQESQHWREQIVSWTGKVTDAQTALTGAQTALTTAQGDYTRAVGEGPKGAAAAAAASAAIGRAQGEVGKATTDLTNARRQLTDAHEQFTHWQERARRIHVDATTAGEDLSLALLVITVVPPPLPGAPDYPALEPTPGILLNDDPGDDEKGGKGDGEQGGKGEDEGEPKKVVIKVGPDGKIIPPPRPETRTEKGDPREALDKAGQRYQQEQGTKPKEPVWVIVMHLLSHLVPKPPPPPPPPV